MIMAYLFDAFWTTLFWGSSYQRFTLGSGVCLILFCSSDAEEIPLERSSMSMCVCRETLCLRKPCSVLFPTDLNDIRLLTSLLIF
jgi:hypothetical protein